MAIKPCRECKQAVSDQAKTCPHCGVAAPVPTASNTIQAVGVIVTLLVTVPFLLWWFFGSTIGGAGPSLTSLLPTDKSFTLVVHCTPRLEFRGSYMVWTKNGGASSHDLSAVCPKSGVVTFDAQGYMVSGSTQKQGEAGWLDLSILANGQSVSAHSETRQPYGLVTAASTP